MITGGEIQNEWDKLGFSITPPGIAVFARAIYQLGRQHQRESDAALCLSIGVEWEREGLDSKALSASRIYTEIRANTGEIK